MHGKILQPTEFDDSRSHSPLESPGLPDERTINIRAAIALIRRQKATISVTIVCVCALAILLASQIDQRFTATALIVVDDDRASQIAGIQDGNFDSYAANTAVDTQVEIARSSSVLARAAIALDIAHSPEFALRPSLLGRLLALYSAEGAQSAPPADRNFDQLTAGEQSRLLDALLKHLRIARRVATSVIVIAATTKSADSAAEMANAVANAYIEEQIESKIDSTQRAVGFLRSRVDSLADDISRIEAERDAFIRTTLSESGSPEAKALLLRLEDEARKRGETSEALLNVRTGLRTDDIDALAKLVSSAERDLAAQRASLTEELAAASSATRADEVRNALADLDAEIRQMGERAATSLQTDLTASEEADAALRRQLQESLTVQKLPSNAAVELFRLQREAETSRTLYSSFLTKVRQVEQQTSFNLPDSRIVSAAAPPIGPSFPPLKLFGAASFLLALCAGVFLAFLREHFIGGVIDVDQLQMVTRLPVVGAVSRYYSKNSSDTAVTALVTQPLSVFSEDIRRARLGVEALSPQHGFCAFVTSTLPDEGKTLIALALARSFAMTGRSTILIDADLRRPSVHILLGTDIKHGLIDYLAQQSGPQELGTVTEEGSGLHYVLGGQASSVPTDALLMSERFAALISYARQKYEIVIIDTPPTGLVVDAAVVARYADVGIFVVRYASTSQRRVRAAVRSLRMLSNKPLCGILNLVAGSSGYGADYSGYHAYYTPPRR